MPLRGRRASCCAAPATTPPRRRRAPSRPAPQGRRPRARIRGGHGRSAPPTTVTGTPRPAPRPRPGRPAQRSGGSHGRGTHQRRQNEEPGRRPRRQAPGTAASAIPAAAHGRGSSPSAARRGREAPGRAGSGGGARNVPADMAIPRPARSPAPAPPSLRAVGTRSRSRLADLLAAEDERWASVDAGAAGPAAVAAPPGRVGREAAAAGVRPLGVRGRGRRPRRPPGGRRRRGAGDAARVRAASTTT